MRSAEVEGPHDGLFDDHAAIVPVDRDRLVVSIADRHQVSAMALIERWAP